nr:AlNc14C3G426 [Albugo laibachii Nc14]|eukprot:CCA14319.1 AlNc14C3G426 [Albugo laibachii Nc14]
MNLSNSGSEQRNFAARPTLLRFLLFTAVTIKHLSRLTCLHDARNAQLVQLSH